MKTNSIGIIFINATPPFRLQKTHAYLFTRYLVAYLIRAGLKKTKELGL